MQPAVRARRAKGTATLVRKVEERQGELDPQQRIDLVVAAAGGATPELIEQLRSLLPEPKDAA